MVSINRLLDVMIDCKIYSLSASMTNKRTFTLKLSIIKAIVHYSSNSNQTLFETITGIFFFIVHASVGIQVRKSITLTVVQDD